MRLGAAYAGGGDTGSVYRYTGAAATLNLGATNYAAGPWVKLVGSDGDLANLWPNLGNLSDSDARAVGGLVVVNDARSAVSAVLEHATATAASLTVSATEAATIAATVDTNVTASGGSAWGSGTVLAVNAQVTTNLVLSSATARISDSAITGAVAVSADNTSAIDARLHSALSIGGDGVRLRDRLQQHRLEAAQRAVQLHRRADRRPADLAGVQRHGSRRAAAR